MNYQETIEYLYNSMPMFQKEGSKAYKEGLENTYLLDEYFGHPHKDYRTIHVAGTNGKGSCSHLLAAVLQEAGYKVGLYTSPHLIDFRERIRVNGKPISRQYVTGFVEKYRAFFEPLYPSFFELTTALAFLYFKEENVDVAIIEAGLGGRLDCTNIICPDLSVITNISFDHTSLLGNSLKQIAAEKAGIIKEGTPVVIGEYTEETKDIFYEKAVSMNAPIVFAEEEQRLLKTQTMPDGSLLYQTIDYKNLHGELRGNYQVKNTNTVLSAINILIRLGYTIEKTNVLHGFEFVTELTGLMGRWQKLQDNPAIVCDTAHNVAGMSYIVEQLSHLAYRKLHFVIGMVNDKDINGVLALLPKEAVYYFTKASVARALPPDELMESAREYKLTGHTYPDVITAVRDAKKNSLPEDFIFVGGSNFVVADLLTSRDTLNLNQSFLG